MKLIVWNQPIKIQVNNGVHLYVYNFGFQKKLTILFPFITRSSKNINLQYVLIIKDKPGPSATRAQREAFIINKYKERTWVDKQIFKGKLI